jgi:hypothetical protein
MCLGVDVGVDVEVWVRWKGIGSGDWLMWRGVGVSKSRVSGFGVELRYAFIGWMEFVSRRWVGRCENYWRISCWMRMGYMAQVHQMAGE